jgi:hypothetical protein
MEGESSGIIAKLSSDTSKLMNAVAIAEGGPNGELRYFGEIPNTEAATRKLVAKLAAKMALTAVWVPDERHEAMRSFALPPGGEEVPPEQAPANSQRMSDSWLLLCSMTSEPLDLPIIQSTKFKFKHDPLLARAAEVIA